MKNYILLFFAALLIGCTSTGVQVTFDDEKSNAIRAHYQNYLDQKLFEVKTSVNKTGYMSQTTYVTGKGETWLFKFLTKNNFI